jgi:hypothetical protein
MKSARYILLICCLMFTGCKTTKTISPQTSQIAVTIPFDSYDTLAFKGFRHHDKFHVLITNISSKPVGVWQEWNSWGYYCLQIEIVERNGTRHLLKKKSANFLVNSPDTVDLKPGGSVVWDVNLDPSEWEDLSWFPKDRSVDARVRAIYTWENSTDEDDIKLGVNRMGAWTGQAASPYYNFTLFGPWLHPTQP